MSLKVSLVIATLWLGVGFLTFQSWSSNSTVVDAFRHARPCLQTSPSQVTDCYTTDTASVEKIDWDPQAHPRGGRSDNTLTLYVQGLGERQTVVSGSVAVYELNPGDSLQVKVWDGKVTDITTLGRFAATAPTHDNPSNEVDYYGSYLGAYLVFTIIGAVGLFLAWANGWGYLGPGGP
jgi:hypothetical protein